MALDQSVLSELLDAFRTGEGLDLIKQAAALVCQELIEVELSAQIGAERYERTSRERAQRAPTPGVVDQGRRRGAVDPKAPKGKLLAFHPRAPPPNSDSPEAPESTTLRQLRPTFPSLRAVHRRGRSRCIGIDTGKGRSGSEESDRPATQQRQDHGNEADDGAWIIDPRYGGIYRYRAPRIWRLAAALPGPRYRLRWPKRRQRLSGVCAPCARRIGPHSLANKLIDAI